ncbi:hypothetical protein ABW19_dt0204598 [Dactylella cylindrospora]|nr:hypothetical protein ABW19_dt0204598 [Dactylella cylindrospora]
MWLGGTFWPQTAVDSASTAPATHSNGIRGLFNPSGYSVIRFIYSSLLRIRGRDQYLNALVRKISRLLTGPKRTSGPVKPCCTFVKEKASAADHAKVAGAGQF